VQQRRPVLLGQLGDVGQAGGEADVGHVQGPAGRVLDEQVVSCAFLVVAIGVRAYDVGGMTNSIIIVALTVAVLFAVVAFDFHRR
jgi:hypothetical protein